jgi:hypothetical protein
MMFFLLLAGVDSGFVDSINQRTGPGANRHRQYFFLARNPRPRPAGRRADGPERASCARRASGLFTMDPDRYSNLDDLLFATPLRSFP